MNTKQLRQKILDLAIRGKLVPQDPADEPASALLERIAAEKARLVKEGKIKADKKPKNTPVTSDKSHYGEFDVPTSWTWVKLGKLGDVGSSKRVFTTELVEKGVPFYRGTEIGALAENKPLKRGLFISKEHYNELVSDSGFPSAGDLLMPSICPDGRIWLVDTEEPFYFKDGRVLWIHFDTKQFDKKYIHIALKTMLIKTFNDIASGSTFAELKIFILKDIVMPLPPLAEQHRIVTAVESAFAVIDEIERSKTDLQTAVTAAKRKILSLAVSGKLVPQDPDDEPAAVLLERIKNEREKLIKAGKIKADKKKKSVESTRDNSHYADLPTFWEICPLNELLDYEQPQRYIVENVDYSDDYTTPVLTANKGFIVGYTNETSGICDELPVIIFDDFTTDFKYVDFTFKVKSSAMKILRSRIADTKYLFYLMQTLGCDHSTHKRYWISDYSLKVVGVPPLAEQHRIVTAIETTFAQLDSITAKLS